MADKTLIYVGAEAHGLYRKEAADSRWEELGEGLPADRPHILNLTSRSH